MPVRHLMEAGLKRPRQVSMHAGVLVGVSLRFNLFASAGWDTNPAAISSRRVEAKARARASAARLMASGPPRMPPLRDAVLPNTCFIAQSWPHLYAQCSNLNICDHRKRLESCCPSRREQAHGEIQSRRSVSIRASDKTPRWRGAWDARNGIGAGWPGPR